MSLKDYERPSLTTDMVLFRMKNYVSANNRKSDAKRLEVLLIERTSEPEQLKWSLPGGFVDIDEEIESNVRRKLMEKTGVSGDFYVEQLYTFGKVDRDSRGRVVSVSYIGLINDDNHTNVGGTEHQTWMDVELALCSDLAFDHKEIIQYAIARLQGKAEYTDILFNLMPK